MSAQSNHTVWTAFLSETAGTIAVGDCLVLNAAGDGYILSTLANRTAAGRPSAGVAITPGDGATNRAVELQFCGVVPESISDLGAGTAGGVHVDDNGRLARGAGDDFVGTCDADGVAYLLFGGMTDIGGITLPIDVGTAPFPEDGQLARWGVPADSTERTLVAAYFPSVSSSFGTPLIRAIDSGVDTATVTFGSRDFQSDDYIQTNLEGDNVALISYDGGGNFLLQGVKNVSRSSYSGAYVSYRLAVGSSGTGASFGGAAAGPMIKLHKRVTAPTGAPSDATNPAVWIWLESPTTDGVHIRFPSGNTLVLPDFDGTLQTSPTAAGTCTLEQFGAVGDGVTSDQVAFSDAEAALVAGSYHTLILGAKTYLVTGTFDLPANCSIIGQGPGASILKTTTNGYLLKINGEDTTLSNFTLLGSSSGSSQDLIRDGVTSSSGSGHIRCMIHNIELKNAGGKGYIYQENPLAASATTFLGPTLTNVRADGCAYGFYFGNRGEYARLVNCHAQQCTTWGLYLGAGNVAFANCIFTANENGVIITDESNSAHSEMTGCAINHNLNKELEIDTSNGHKFVGCSIYGTHTDSLKITTNARGILFVGCQIEVSEFDFAANVTARFVSCIVGDAFSPVRNDIASSAVTFEGCRKKDGTITSLVQAGLRQSHTFATDANVTLDARVGVAEELIFETGAITVSRQVTIPESPDKGRRKYIVNNTAQNLTFKWSSGSTVTVNSGKTAIIGADGTNATLVLVGA